MKPPHLTAGNVVMPDRFAGLGKVRQSIGEGTSRWWERLGDGRLAVALPYGSIVVAPVAEAALTAPIPDRSPNPDRITCALDMRGMEGPEVDEALGVSTPDDHVVDAWEAGTLVPSHSEIRRLATLTHYPVAFFYAGTIKPVGNMFICPPPELTIPISDMERENAALKAEIASLKAAAVRVGGTDG